MGILYKGVRLEGVESLEVVKKGCVAELRQTNVTFRSTN